MRRVKGGGGGRGREIKYNKTNPSLVKKKIYIYILQLPQAPRRQGGSQIRLLQKLSGTNSQLLEANKNSAHARCLSQQAQPCQVTKKLEPEHRAAFKRALRKGETSSPPPPHSSAQAPSLVFFSSFFLLNRKYIIKFTNTIYSFNHKPGRGVCWTEFFLKSDLK